MIKYSIVVPVFNAGQSLRELCERTEKTLSAIGTWELVLVDDGSSDDSWEVMQACKKVFGDKIQIVRLSKNFGQHNAITCGFVYSKGEFIITIDDDLQHPPEEIPKLIREQEKSGADLVYGIPRNRQHGFIRTAGSYFVTKSSKVTQGNTEGSSFRILRKSIADKIEKHQHKSMIYIDEIVSWYTSNISKTDVEHHVRKHGVSGYSTGKLLRLYFDILFNHSAFPLKLMTWVGFLSSLTTLLLGVHFIIRKYLLNVPIGFTALIVTILFSSSILMMCMGILGQYLYKLYLLQNRRPGYYVREHQ